MMVFIATQTGAHMSRKSSFKNLGEVWWNWVVENAPEGQRASRRNVASILGISYQAVSAISDRPCTLDRVYDYITKLADKGWPETRIIVEGVEVKLEPVMILCALSSKA